VLRGDLMTDVSDNDKTSPACRCEGVKCCEANKVLRGQDKIGFSAADCCRHHTVTAVTHTSHMRACTRRRAHIGFVAARCVCADELW